MSGDAPPLSALLDDAPSRPPVDESSRKRARALLHKGATLHQNGQAQKAMPFYEQAIAADPGLFDAWSNMGVALRARGQQLAAVACYRRALTLKPTMESAWNNLGNAYRDLGRHDEAIDAYSAAVKIKPDYVAPRYGIALVHRDRGELDKAQMLLKDVLAQKPDDPEINWDLALTLLESGDYVEGLKAFEWRWKLDRAKRRSFAQPHWDGQSDLAGKTILLYSEQGFGDIIQFVRFVPALVARGARVVLEVRPELKRLLKMAPGVSFILAKDEPEPPHALVYPIMSLPMALGLRREDISPEPYLPFPEGDHHPLPLAAAGAKLNVALVWGGSPTHRNDRNRSCPFEHFLSLAGRADCAFYSIQKGDRAKELRQSGAGPLIIDLGDQIKDFADTAELLSQMDLVIAIDSSPVHLAGALGVPAWALLPFTPDWRWGTRGETTHWYSQCRLFRQEKPGDWAGVFKAVNAALDQKIYEQKSDADSAPS